MRDDWQHFSVAAACGRPLGRAVVFLAASLLGTGALLAQVQETDVQRALDAWGDGDPRALAELRRAGDAAAAAVVQRIETAFERNKRPKIEHELRLLVDLGAATPAVLQALTAAAERVDDPVRVQVLRTIGNLAPELADPQPLLQWLETVEKEQPAVVQAFRVALPAGRPMRMQPMTELERVQTRLRLRDERKLATLIELLADQDVDVAEFAAERLGARGPEAAGALAGLLELRDAKVVTMGRARVQGNPLAAVQHGPSEHKRIATEAIVRIAPDSAEAVAAHIQLLATGNPEQRLASLLALRMRPEHAEPAAVAVAELLDGRHHRVLRREALITLSTFGRAAARAVPALRKLARTGDEELAKLAKSALRAIEAQ